MIKLPLSRSWSACLGRRVMVLGGWPRHAAPQDPVCLASGAKAGTGTGRETALNEAGGCCSRKQARGNEIQSLALLGLFLSKVHLSKDSGLTKGRVLGPGPELIWSCRQDQTWGEGGVCSGPQAQRPEMDGGRQATTVL